ncbi:MAG TPA: hypothetical protein VE913_24215, partial [Longimicrobium sp.]|nr:hypothetical protein [Longimicrobium sp.]
MSTLAALLTSAALLKLAGPTSIARGRLYYREGRVHDVAATDGEASARVEGSESYRARLWDEGGRPRFDCTCPVGIDLRFCKHCVAVAMVVNPALDPLPAPRADPLPEIRAFLERQDRAGLIELMMEYAAEDSQLRMKLGLRVASTHPGGAVVEPFRRAISHAFAVPDYEEYGDAGGYVDRMYDVLAELATLVGTDPAAAIPLLEQAAKRAESAVDSVEDDGDEFPGIFAEIAELHLRACERARPDPEELAARLFKLEMESDYETFADTARSYADVLGDTGLAAYRALAEKAWATIAPLSPGENDTNPRRHKITRVMEALAEAEGVEAIVEVRRRNLSTAQSYLRIAELYRDAGDSGSAIEWAEAGLAAFPGRVDVGLRGFLTEENQRLGRHDEAMRLAWSAFTDVAGVEAFRRLRERATRADAWPEWRERAIAFMREGASTPGGNSYLIRVFLAEGSVEEAWSEARRGGCSEEVWFELARAREAEHPADAIPIYQRRIEVSVASGSNRGYA